jgi:RNA polymerase sigma factor (sigma-70 family)
LTGVSDQSTQPLDEGALRALVPRVLAGLVRRGEEFDAAEDALQEALLEALRAWPEHPPENPQAWLATVAARRLVDARRSEAARLRREEGARHEPARSANEEGDDTLFLLFCCCNPDLAPASQVALTLRAVGGLTTKEIADAFFVPEATMAQRSAAPSTRYAAAAWTSPATSPLSSASFTSSTPPATPTPSTSPRRQSACRASSPWRRRSPRPAACWHSCS